jgi:hypothetical protein
VLDTKAPEHVAALDGVTLGRRLTPGEPAGVAVGIDGDLPLVPAGASTAYPCWPLSTDRPSARQVLNPAT